jgi:hypothetical protein
MFNRMITVCLIQLKYKTRPNILDFLQKLINYKILVSREMWYNWYPYSTFLNQICSKEFRSLSRWDKWIPVTKVWRILRSRMEARPPLWRVGANKLNKQSRTADKRWSSSLGVGRGSNNASPWKPILRNTHKARCFLWRQNNPEVNYSPTRISGGGRGGRGSVSRGSITQQEPRYF